MPVLTKWPLSRESQNRLTPVSAPGGDASSAAASAFFPFCANAHCKSGWMKLWRSRQAPILEGKWACSSACMQAMVKAAVLREMAETSQGPSVHQHRVPIGLLLLSQGHITQEQLRRALVAQKESGSGRLGEWLIKQKAVDEDRVTRALGAQWNCPVLSADSHDPAAMAAMLPRLLVDSFGMLPLRLAGRRLLYVAFEDRIDRCMTLAMERMSGLQVEAGLLRGSEFRRLRQEALRAPFPKIRLLEMDNVRSLVLTLSGMIEERKPTQARLVRVHDYFWLRLWHTSPEADDRKPAPVHDRVEDMVCSLAQLS
jgi:hypothetical protein